MNNPWTIAQPRPHLRVVKLLPSILSEEPVVAAEELSVALAGTLPDETASPMIELDFSGWHDVDSRMFALLVYLRRRCLELNYMMTISSPPRLLTQMATRLGIADELGLGVARSRDYSQLFLSELVER